MQKSDSNLAPSVLTINNLLSETAKQLRQPATYSKKNLATQWQRSKRVVSLMAAIQTGIGYAWQISRTPNPDNQQIIQ